MELSFTFLWIIHVKEDTRGRKEGFAARRATYAFFSTRNIGKYLKVVILLHLNSISE